MIDVGAAKAQIQINARGIGMMGYGAEGNKIHHAHSDLFARACVFRDEQGHWAAFINLEICFITQALHQALLARLADLFPELQAHNVMLTAQHTHSGPGGHSHYVFYNMTISGFQPLVFDAMLEATVQAVLSARAVMRPAQLYYGAEAFADSLDVAFNRSLAAYNANPENQVLSEEQTHLAVDRTMHLLKAVTTDGCIVAVINWFGVHATNIGPKNQGLCSDNKGFAALDLEQSLRQQGHDAVAIFAQAVAGDVSPNFYGQGKNWPRGKFQDELESARFNGRLQSKQAQHILAQDLNLLEPSLAGILDYVDLSSVNCDPAFTGGKKDCRTAPAAHGVAFLKGTAIDGKGLSPALANALSAFCRLQQQMRLKRLSRQDQAAYLEEKSDLDMQAPKVVAIESGRRRFLGFEDLTQLPIPQSLDAVLDELRDLMKRDAINEHSWTPQVLPLQLLRLGSLVIVGFPGELTTTAGRRLKASLQNLLPDSTIVISCYANAYFGYTTTAEEYALQTYEGGHTVFGRWTLAAFQTLYTALASHLGADPPPAPRCLPPRFSETEMSRRTGAPSYVR